MADKHLLVTISDNNNLAGIHFICSFFQNKRDLKITLLYVAPSLSSEAVLNEAWLSPEEKGSAKAPAIVEQTMTHSRLLLCKSGIDDDCVDTKITAKLQTKVKDIIREGQKGKYDAVVFGSRTSLFFEGFIEENVIDEIIDQNIDFPLWICRSPEAGRKNVLLCLDGSYTAIEVADHVGYMISDQEDHKVTLFHVDRGQNINIAKSFEAARKILLEHNVSESRISTKIVKAARVGQAIIKEAETHKYAVVAIGLLGRQNEGIKGWFISSKISNLLKNVDKAVIWCCR